MPNFASRTSPRGRARYEVDCSEVISYTKNIENQVSHHARIQMHELDERIWRLEKYVLEELNLNPTGTDARLWPSYTDNGPRTYWNAIRRAVTSNPPRMRIKLPSLMDDNLDRFEEMLIETDRHEHFTYGLWSQIDEQRLRRGERPFQDDVAWQLAIRGGVFLRPWLNPDASRFPFSCPIWDPKTVAYEQGEDGLEFACHHYSQPYYQVERLYYPETESKRDELRNSKDVDGNIETFDAWWMEYDRNGKGHVWNAVVTAGGFELLPAKEHRDLDHLPVYLMRSFGPTVEPNPNYHYTAQKELDAWETIYSANRDIYPWINRVMTLYGLYLRSGAIGPWFAKRTGLNDEQLKNAIRPFQVVQSNNPDAMLQALQPPQMAAEAKELLSQLQGAEQRGGVPYSMFGTIPFQLSGFAVNQLQGSVSITAGEIAKTLANAYRICTDEIIQQFRQRGRRVTLKGMDTRRQQFIEEIKRADLRDKYYLEVEIAPEVPIDKLQQAQIAREWKQIGIDTTTIIDEVLKLPSPREVYRRIIAEKQLMAELEQRAMEEEAAMQQEQGGPMNGASPELVPPEVAGLLSQHAGFAPSWQQTPYESMDAAGFAVPSPP